jgi:hypothetical protein
VVAGLGFPVRVRRGEGSVAGGLRVRIERGLRVPRARLRGRGRWTGKGRRRGGGGRAASSVGKSRGGGRLVGGAAGGIRVP